MAPQHSIDVTEVIDGNRVSPFQVMIFVLCFLVIAVDGFDTAAIGFMAPAISAQWHVAPAQLAPVFGAGLVGLMIGALVSGPLADRLGRRRLLLLSVLVFGVVSVISARADSLHELIVLRFLTGLGLGGAMPNAITLTSEYCPSTRRMSLVAAMTCGFTLGSAIGGFAAAMLIEHYGWRSVFLAGGIIPLLLLPLLVGLLPESVRYLVAAGKQPLQVVRVMARIAPSKDFSAATFTTSRSKVHKSPVAQLFRQDLVRSTLLLWLTFFMSLLVIYLLSSWLPTLLRTIGTSLQTAALVTAMFQVGGTVGGIALGWMMDRYNPQYVLAGSYVAAALFIVAVGSLTTMPWLVALVVFCAGFCISGAQVGMAALATAIYPTDCRVTGVSWANGVGRMGSVVGSLAGGTMLAIGLSMPVLFLIIGVPAAIAGVSMAILGQHRARTHRVSQTPSLSPAPQSAA